MNGHARHSIPPETRRPYSLTPSSIALLLQPLRFNPNVPARLDEINHKALEKDRDMRYQHASDPQWT